MTKSIERTGCSEVVVLERDNMQFKYESVSLQSTSGFGGAFRNALLLSLQLERLVLIGCKDHRREGTILSSGVARFLGPYIYLERAGFI